MTYTATAYATEPGSGLVPIPLPSGPAGPPLGVVGTQPVVAITPDGRYALVGSGSGGPSACEWNDLVGLTSGSIALPSGATSVEMVACSPDGSTFWAISTDKQWLYPITVGTWAVGTGFAVAVTTGQDSNMALSPDGLSAWVTSYNHGTLTQYTLTSGATGSAYTLGGHPYGIAITPDGTKACVVDYGANTIAVVRLSDGTVLHTVTGVGAQGLGVAITPDGLTAVATGGSSTTSGYVIFTIATGTITASGTISGGFPWQIAISPDGVTAYIPSTHGSTGVWPATIATGVVGSVITTSGAVWAVAVTPDQAPTAAFTLGAPSGLTVGVATDTSSTPVGTITNWHMDWDDGNTNDYVSRSAFLAATHTYSAPSTYNPTLTVTNSAGTSGPSSTTFTGQTVSNHGGSSAHMSHSVTVSAGGQGNWAGTNFATWNWG